MSRLASDGNITLSYTPNNLRPLEELYNRIRHNLNHLGMHPHHLIPRTAYMKNDIPDCRLRPPGRHHAIRQRSGHFRAGHRLQGT